MEVNDQTLATLRDLIVGILSSDNVTRKSAEAYLQSTEAQPGFSILVLTLIKHLAISNDPKDIAIRQTASVLFKNLIKNRWKPIEDDSITPIAIGDRDLIKTHVIDLMCITPSDVQSQLAEAVTLISKHDFPNNWKGLLPQLVSRLGSSQDLFVTKGVILTANSIMKRFRYVYRSDELYEELVICLQGFQVPLLQQYQASSELVTRYANNKLELITIFETLRLMSRIFFSLNWQDIPEYFEDNVVAWMTEFAKYLTYRNPMLIEEEEESEPGPIEKLQSAILENINLYANKYEDIFIPFLPQFTQVVWKLLIEVGRQAKYDILATSAIKFLTSVSGKQMNMELFTEPVLKDIVEQIVVKNLTATETDEELFEDNPTDYIRKDMEGSDQDTRRRSASELVRSLLKFFGPQMSQLCNAYINAMLEHYSVTKDWKAKDAALHLVLAVAVKSSSSLSGAGELNPLVNILGIFDTHVLPEVHDSNVNMRPIVKADAIKLICVFRSHLPTTLILNLLPHLIRHLHSKHVVIQTYAAMCIERFLTIKDRDLTGKATVCRITKDSLVPYYQSLFTGLFSVLENKELPENDYVMKCIMRTILVIGGDIGPVTEFVLSKLTVALERVCKNPINPHYNHYLFESVALLVRSCCNITINATLTSESALIAASRFEVLLFPPFQAVLNQDVTEFVPYVFQILGQLLCSRSINAGYSDAYKALFPPLLSPVLWERKGNVPALSDLFTAYISRAMQDIAVNNYITGVLGVFQKLLASKATEVYSFKILNAIYVHSSLQILLPYLPTILNLLLQRMQESVKESKTTKYCRMFLHSFCVFCSVHGCNVITETLESITPGLLSMIVLNIWVPNRAACLGSSGDQEIKQMIVGITRLLVENVPVVIQKPEVWCSLLQTVWFLLDQTSSSTTNLGDDLFQGGGDDEEEGVAVTGGIEFDSAYSKLAYATIPAIDPCTEINSGIVYFTQRFSQFIQTNNQFVALISQALEPQSVLNFQALLAKHSH